MWLSFFSSTTLKQLPQKRQTTKPPKECWTLDLRGYAEVSGDKWQVTNFSNFSNSYSTWTSHLEGVWIFGAL